MIGDIGTAEAPWPILGESAIETATSVVATWKANRRPPIASFE
jgi:hypothetical protein